MAIPISSFASSVHLLARGGGFVMPVINVASRKLSASDGEPRSGPTEWSNCQRRYVRQSASGRCSNCSFKRRKNFEGETLSVVLPASPGTPSSAKYAGQSMAGTIAASLSTVVGSYTFVGTEDSSGVRDASA